jgi:mannose-6-phosphate isomerase-like protein (cupin superfamily)
MTFATLNHVSRGPSGGHVRSYLGLRFGFLADATDTGGAYSIMEVQARPGMEPPPHIHSGEDEAFYILDGAWTFRCGDTATDAGPGTLLFLPRGLMHDFTAHNELCRALVIMSPGGLETAFRELSEPLPPGTAAPQAEPPPIAHVLDTFRRRGVQFAPPESASSPAGWSASDTEEAALAERAAFRKPTPGRGPGSG